VYPAAVAVSETGWKGSSRMLAAAAPLALRSGVKELPPIGMGELLSPSSDMKWVSQISTDITKFCWKLRSQTVNNFFKTSSAYLSSLSKIRLQLA
jgi:hypothetical protein